MLNEQRSDFGDWEAEYAALVESCALVDRADRAAVRLTGERSAEMLNGLVTNDLRAMKDRGARALLLTAKGRVLTDLRAFPSAGDVLVDVPLPGLENLLAAFQKYLPPLYARFENVSDSVRTVGVYGPLAAEAAEAALGAAPPEPDLGVRLQEVGGERLLVIRDRRLAADGVEIIGAATALEDLAARTLSAVEARSGRAAGRAALEVVRVEAGVPLYGTDMSDENLAQETGLEDAISHEKGCYLGQETVARIHFRGHVNRHLRGLQFEGESPESGAELFDGEKKVGSVTSSVASPRFGPIGLGYVRREIELGHTLEWAQGDVRGATTVKALPFRAVSV